MAIRSQKEQEKIWAQNAIRSQDEQEKIWARNSRNIKDASRISQKAVSDGVEFPRINASPDIYQSAGKKSKIPLNVVKTQSTSSYVYVKLNPGMVGSLTVAPTNTLTITKLATRYVWLKLVFKNIYDSQPSSFEFTSGASVPNGGEKEAYLPLAAVESGKITNYLSGSVGCHFASPDLLLWKL